MPTKKRPIIEDAETGERIPEYTGGGGSSGGINIGDAIGAGKAIWNAETGAEVIQIGAGVWNSLSPEQKQAVLNALKKVAVATPVVIGKSIHHLQYLKNVSGGLSALKKVFGGGGSQRSKTSKSKVINSNEGQFTVINKPSSNSSPRRKPRQNVILF